MSERAWILLPSGKQLDLLDPDPWAWTDDDLAIGLSRTTDGPDIQLGTAALRCPALADGAGPAPEPVHRSPTH